MEPATKPELAARLRALEKIVAREKAGHARTKKALAEALEQQSASAAILRLISGASTSLQTVLDAVAEHAAKLCEARDALLALREGNLLRYVAHHGDIHTTLAVQGTREITRRTVQGQALLDGRQIHVLDLQKETRRYPDGAALARASAFRAGLVTPLMRDGAAIGTIIVRRAEARAFSERQMALVKTFADQAVIAIENARLFKETKEALERQTATAEILEVIASSPSNVQPVFDTIIRSAIRLMGGFTGGLFTFDGALVHIGAAARATGANTTSAFQVDYPAPIDYRAPSVQAIRERRILNVPDVLEGDYAQAAKERARAGGYRASLSVPTIHCGLAIGSIAVTRRDAGPFPDHHIQLLKSFADQAVIAIENVRLFNETKKALERQTATAEVLRVISSTPTDARPVFNAIVQSALRLFDGMGVHISLIKDGCIDLAAAGGTMDFEVARRDYPMPISRDSVNGTAILERRLVNIPDCQSPDTPARARNNSIGFRSVACAPLLRQGTPIGSLGVTRKTAGGLDGEQLALLQTFADQAVIAIENARLFNDTAEALEQQKASAEVLGAISASITDTKPVFDKILESCLRLFEGFQVGIIVVGEDGLGHMAAYSGPEKVHEGFPIPITRGSGTGLAILERRMLHYPDILGAPDVPEVLRRNATITGSRAVILAPMLREGQGVGAIVVSRTFVGPFSEKAIRLLKTFADQAVIAIENVRLFKELEARTEALSKSVRQLTALSEVGQAISSSLELETVLKAIVSRAVQLTGLDGGSIYEYDEATEEFRLQAAERMESELVEAVRTTPIRKGDGATGRTAVTLEPVQVPDLGADSYTGSRKDVLVRAGYRALLAVPLLREGRLLGALLVNRKTPGEFAPEAVELLQTFATQSALAIQNARLFREIAEKSRQLEVASRHKSDFLASMSHELRTPLNAILGFNEMILGELYGPVPADMREPLADIQTSGKHLLRLINNVLDLAKIEAGRMELALSEYAPGDLVESVRATLRPLAAEKGLEFATSVSEDLPVARGDAGRLTQCLMNLAGNALKFTRQGRVEIAVERRDGMLLYRVADTGMGIPADKIPSLFSEFRQTDATIASEYGGTGLGLSISRKFVEMHGGRIWVESEPGKGSVFLFTVPVRAGEDAAA